MEYICNICNTSFGHHKGRFEDHINNHPTYENGEFICSCCKPSKRYFTLKGYNMHISFMSNEKLREAKHLAVKNQWKNKDHKDYMSKISSKRMSDWWSDKNNREYGLKRLEHHNKAIRNNPVWIENWTNAISHTDEYYSDLVKSIDNEFEFIKSYYKNNKYLLVRHKCGEEREIQASHIESLICQKCNPYGSRMELELLEYLNKFDKFEKLNRYTKYPFEIDMSNGKIAIECNGLYWHCSKQSHINKNYHKNKTDLLLKDNIKLIHLWSDWNIDLCKSILSSRLGLNNKIYARKLNLIEPNRDDVTRFLSINHIHGTTKYKKAFALEDNGNIIECITLRTTNGELEIARLATRKYTTVVGGFSKLMSAVKAYAETNGYSRILTYLYRDLCPDYHDSVYYKYGFNFIGDSGPILYFYNHSKDIRESRQKYQKHLLKNIYSDYDNTPAEKFLKTKGIYTIYDSGNYKFILDIKR